MGERALSLKRHIRAFIADILMLLLLANLSSFPSSAKDAVGNLNVNVQPECFMFKPSVASEECEEIDRTYFVMLVTGDVVTVGVTRDNRTVVLSVSPRDSTKYNRGFRVFEDKRGVYVIPSDVDLRKVDINLFNVKYLVDEKYYELPNVPLIIELSKNVPSTKALAAIQSILNASKNERITRSYNIISATSVQVSSGETFYKLLSSEYVSKIWLNYRVRTFLLKSAPIIGAPEVWNLGYNGSGIKIAILDTGIDPTHPHFYFSNGTSKIVFQADFTDDRNPYDYFGHGTHVASIAAGAELYVNESCILKGIAPGALIMNVKVLNREGWGWLEWVIAGVEYAALGPDYAPNTGDEADILNLSLGAAWWTDGRDPLSMACDAAVDLGCVVVVAAGNYGGYFSVGVPATARKVITVGASDKLDQIASFSSRGPTVDFRVKPDLVAPGVNIWAALARGSLIEYWANKSWIPGMDIDGDGRYDLVCLSGTSMATPHVSGAAALVKQARQLNSTMIKNLLISTSKDLGYDVYTQGGGRLNVLAAVESNILVSPATVSLGTLLKTATYNFNLTLINVGSETISISLLPRLTRMQYGGNYSGLVSLNVTKLSLPAGGSRGVMVKINTTGLPIGYYSGLINTNYTIASSNLHVIFGFRLTNRVDVTFYGPDGATPLKNRPVFIFRANATTWEERYEVWRYTDEYGRVTFYEVPDGLCYIVGIDENQIDYCNAYAIEKAWVTGYLNVTLSLKGAHKISYVPPVSNQIIAGLFNGLSYAYYNETCYYGYFIGIGYYWYYPLKTDIYVTSTDLIFSSRYQHYDRRYINVPNPSVLTAPELYSTVFLNKSITGSKTVSFSTSKLVRVEKNYKVALTPSICARIYRTHFASSADWYWFGIWIGGFDWLITSPRTLVEYLGWEIPPSANHYCHVGYHKEWDQPNIWTPYFRFYGHEVYWRLGAFSMDVNSHPLDPHICIHVWSYGDGNIANLYFYSDLFCEIVTGPYYYLTSDHGLVIVRRNGTEIYCNNIFNFLHFSTDIDLPAKIEVELYAYSNMNLSTEAITRVEFEVPVNGLALLYTPFSLRIDGLDLNNTHLGGNVKGFIYKLQDMRNTTLEYSFNDGETWSQVTLSEKYDHYNFTLPNISEKFVSFRINSTVNGHIKMSYTILRAFYIKRVEIPPTYPLAYPDLYALVTGLGGEVWYRKNVKGEWHPWTLLGGVSPDAPSAAFYSGRLYVAVRGLGNTIWYGYVNASTNEFSGWISVPGLTPSKPSLVATSKGILMFVRGVNNEIWIYNWFVWILLPGATCDTPVAIPLGDKVHIVVRGVDGYSLWHGILDTNTWAFSGWRAISGLTDSTPELIADEDNGIIYLFVKGLDNSIYMNIYTEILGWHGWIRITGGATDKGLAAVIHSNSLQIMVKSLGNDIWIATKQIDGSWIWNPLDGATQNQPELVKPK